MVVKIRTAYVKNASSRDITELERAYGLIRPKDPDRLLYRLIHWYYPEGVFVYRTGKKLTSAAYCIGFSTGFGCIGGFFLDRENGGVESISAVISRCLLHLRAKGCAEVFSSVREQNLEELVALKAAGFTALYRRAVGTIYNMIKKTQSNGFGVLCNQSEAHEVIERFVTSPEVTAQKGTITSCFWLHRLSDLFMYDFLNMDDVLVIRLSQDKDDLVLARISPAIPTTRRWFIFPPNLLSYTSKQCKKVGEILLMTGTNRFDAVSAVINRLRLYGAQRIYLYTYEPDEHLPSYLQLGFRFDQPKIILSRCNSRSNLTTQEAPVSVVFSTLSNSLLGSRVLPKEQRTLTQFLKSRARV